jgi:hypothetical protein
VGVRCLLGEKGGESMNITLPRATVQQAIEGDCILWAGSLSQGYGIICNYNGTGRRKRAHLAAWESAHGPIPDGYVLDHLCRRRSCCNVDHLEVVSGKENTLRGIGPTAENAKKTHCKHGHPFDEANTGMTRLGRRYCRTCSKQYTSDWREKTGNKHGRKPKQS